MQSRPNVAWKALSSSLAPHFNFFLPVVPARGGAEVALGLYYNTFFIYRTCMRRAPARPVRACFARACCTVVVQEHDLRATPVQCNSKRTLSSHCILHSSHPALHTSHLHFTLHTSPHLKSCELFSPHLTSSQLFSSHPISSHMSSKYISSSQLFSSHPSTDQRFSFPRSSSQLVSAVLHARKLLLSERSLLHKKTFGHRKLFAHRSLRHRCIYTEKPLQNTLYDKACTTYFPVLLCTTKAWTLHYTAYTQYFPVLCTTKACTLYY